MTEDEITREMYQAATTDKSIRVLSWQGVGGKSYLTRSIRLVSNGKVYLPDLILLDTSRLWIIEVKGSHAEARAEDEPKLSQLRDQLTDDEIRLQVARSGKVPLRSGIQVISAVAYSVGLSGPGCDESVHHIAWQDVRPNIVLALTTTV